jgi:hypothetical protein
MKYGFTGTRRGMTMEQINRLIEVVGPGSELDLTEFHHGDCVGADDDAAGIVHAYANGAKIVCHPPIEEKHRAYNGNYHERREPKKYFMRNREIVHETERLIACPEIADAILPETMGGTAYTVNYARKCGKPILIIKPDGDVIYE